jgi:hypothetical protein
MSYASLDVSEQSAQPVLLFTFVRSNTAWYYCAGSEPFIYNGHSHAPIVLLSSSFAFTGDQPKDTLDLEFDISNVWAMAFLAGTLDAVTTLTVRRIHRGDTEARIMWKGRVLSSNASRGSIKLICEPVSLSLHRLGLRQTYQRLCRHAFGDIGCNVDRANYSELASIDSIDGATVTFTSALVADHAGGVLEAPDGTRRMIVSVGSNYVQLIRPIASLTVEDTVTLYQGCDRTTTMCASRFGNIGNYGGFAGIPWINPMTNVSVVF